ncbi:hypothetical protein [Agromyces silvae]|uniref:hypothetical protein n=1 Tax=Agromyces silvae TaxID=3388266 RepID=UPI00280A51F2|nr:hypothetical protein [Agromyces protaetiae]
MIKPTRRVPRSFAAAALAIGVSALAVIAAPHAAMAQPAEAAAPTISIGDGTVASSDASIASVPITYQCEAGTAAAIVVKMRQPFGEYAFVDGVTSHTVACTGETTTITTSIASNHRDPWHAGQATGEVSIYGQSTATAHQPFSIVLRS